MKLTIKEAKEIGECLLKMATNMELEKERLAPVMERLKKQVPSGCGAQSNATAKRLENF